MTPQRTYVLFDMDGTLLRLSWGAEALRPLREQVREVLRALGKSPPFGMLIPTLAMAGRDDPANALLVETLEAEAAAQATACPGALEVLDDLHPARYALVTSNGRACALRALQVAGIPRERFSAVVCREDTPLLKPDPQPMRRALGLLTAAHGPPARVLVVGDAATDLQAAAALRPEVPCPLLGIGVLGGVSAEEALRAAGADAVLASVRGLGAYAG